MNPSTLGFWPAAWTTFGLLALAITLLVFVPFAVFAMNQPLKLDFFRS